MATDDRTDRDIAALTELWSVAAQAYLDGDLPRYAALANHAPDFTLTPPYGGNPRHGFDGSDQAVERTANTFRGGDVDLEVHASYASDGLAVLVDSTGLSATCPARSGHSASPWSSAGPATAGSWCTGTPTHSPAPSPTSSSRRSREESMPRDEIHLSGPRWCAPVLGPRSR